MAVYPVCKNDPGVAVNLNLGIILKATGWILTICVIIILLLMFACDMCSITLAIIRLKLIIKMPFESSFLSFIMV
jgi:hypothetical protein